MSTSHVLRNIIGCIILIGTGSASEELGAVSYCTVNGCHVTPPSTAIPGYGGGGGGWGNDGNSGDLEREYTALWCQDAPTNFWEYYSCNLNSPPPLEVNGCGTAGGIPVPDFLIAPGAQAAAAAAFGGIFTEACNSHDRCYGTAGSTKSSCDNNLYNDMVAVAEERIPQAVKTVFIPFAQGQAWAYSKFLQWEYVAPWTSNPAFNSAQDEALCRKWSSEYHDICSQ